jgi:hypothetical protein
MLTICRLDAAVFSYSDGSLFSIDELGVKCIALSSVASGLGLFFVSLFLLKYSFTDVRRFQVPIPFHICFTRVLTISVRSVAHSISTAPTSSSRSRAAYPPFA